MTPEECAQLVVQRRPRIVVVGDYMLDGWWNGSAHRVAREAPAPVVELETREVTPGGAGNTALNVALLGASAQAVGVVGADATGEELAASLAGRGVDTTHLLRAAGEHTTSKVRITVDDHVLVRLDEVHREWPEATNGEFARGLQQAIDGCDALLVCDYGGSLSHEAVRDALRNTSRPPLIVVDAHDPRRWRSIAPDVITPNAAEAERVSGVVLGEGEGRAAAAETHARDLFAATGASAVIVTLDETGTVLLREGAAAFRTYAEPAPERHASGAGDVFAAAFTVALAAGVDAEDAARFAQRAADIAVRRAGTCVCTAADFVPESSEGEGARLRAAKEAGQT